MSGTVIEESNLIDDLYNDVMSASMKKWDRRGNLISSERQ